jgi:FlaA1/EpsC-like NDP-sugar epimerase
VVRLVVTVRPIVLTLRKLFTWSRIPPRGWFVFGHDLIMAAASFVISLYLRVGSDIYLFFPHATLVLATVVFTVIAGSMFLITNLYKGVWRYASVVDLLSIARAVSLTIALFLIVLFLWTRLEPMPRSVPIINWFVLVALLGAPRFLYRIAKDHRLELRLHTEGVRRIPVVLVGSGHEAEVFIRALRGASQRLYHVVGIVAEKRKRVGQNIHGVPVLGTTEEIGEVVAALKAREQYPERLVLADEHMDGAVVRGLLETASNLGMTLARVPRLTDFKHSVAAHTDRIEMRPIAIEDLLGRPQTPLDRDGMRAMIAGRRVAVTGAGGSIGSELVRQISEFAPAQLLLIEQSEFNLYAIEKELQERAPKLSFPAVLADVRKRRSIGRLFACYRPEIVFHAAALKHVPLVEANPFEGMVTNVMGTVNVADACLNAGTATMVLISTDKAINPTSIMGASKRIAERYCQALDMRRRNIGGTRFVAVRFGNVLGSSGSVVPLFQKQLAAGGPLTVTHPDMKRYFMSVREAVELVLQASVLGQRYDVSEGKIFVLDMGEPVRILDLARQMIRLAGLRPDLDIKIEITGVRAGEKLFEELFDPSEDILPTEYAGITLAAPGPADLKEFVPALKALEVACAESDETLFGELVQRLVPEYRGSFGTQAPRAAAGF